MNELKTIKPNSPANFTPTLGNYRELEPFRFWCQKVLPLVYDDSLSYYETLCKVMHTLNEVIDNVNNIPNFIRELISDEKIKDILSLLLDTLEEQIASANEHASKTATTDRKNGDLVWLNGYLYRVTRDMFAGDQYVENSNCIKITIEEWTNKFIETVKSAISDETEARKNSDITLQNNIDAETEARKNSDITLQNNIDAEKESRKNSDITLQNNIDAETEARKKSDITLQNNIDAEKTTREKYIVYTPSDLTETDANIGLKKGVYNVTSDIFIRHQLVIPEGAIINVADGVTLTINGKIVADAYKIFSGNGNIVTNEANTFGYCEWFGGKTNDPSVDNSIPINKTLSIFKTCVLNKGKYYISNPIILNESNMKLIGSGMNNLFNDYDSTIIDTRNAGYSVLIGSETEQTEINNYPIGIVLKNLIIDRNVNLVNENTVGVKTKQNLHCVIENIMCKKSAICYLLNKSVFLRFINNRGVQYFTNIEHYAIRCTDGVSVGVVGNNASIYIKDFSCVGSNDDSKQNIGLKVDNAPADMFIDGFETSGYQQGIVIDDVIKTLNSSNDIHIKNAIIDGFSLHGIYLHNLSNSGSVTIENCYCAPNNHINTYAYRVYETNCAISFIGNQAVLNSGNETAIGFYFSDCSSILCKGNIITNAKRPYVIEKGISYYIGDIITMYYTSNSPIIDIAENAEGIYAQPILTGISNAYPYVIKRSNNLPTELNVSAINKACIKTALVNDGTNDYNDVGLKTNILISGVLTV